MELLGQEEDEDVNLVPQIYFVAIELFAVADDSLPCSASLTKEELSGMSAAERRAFWMESGATSSQLPLLMRATRYVEVDLAQIELMPLNSYPPRPEASYAYSTDYSIPRTSPYECSTFASNRRFRIRTFSAEQVRQAPITVHACSVPTRCPLNTYLFHQNKGDEPPLVSHPPHGLAGARNPRNVCYLNAALHLLYHLLPFRMRVMKLSPIVDSLSVDDRPVRIHLLTLSAIQYVFEQFATSLTPCRSSEELLCSRLPWWSSVSIHDEHDSHEFLLKLLHKLEDELDGLFETNLVRDVFRGECREFKRKIGAEISEKPAWTAFYDVTANVFDSESLRSSLYEHFEPSQPPEGFRFWTQWRHSPPPVLLVRVHRFSFDPVYGNFCKSTQRWSYPPVLDLREFEVFAQNQGGILQKKNASQISLHYELVGFVEHSGNFTAVAHYMTTVRRLNQEHTDFTTMKGSWLKLNDAYVYPVGASGVFGDHFGPASQETISNKWSLPKPGTVYVLAYVRV